MTTTSPWRAVRIAALVLAAFAVLLSLLAVAPAAPARADDLDRQRREAEREKRQLDADLEHLAQELEEVGAELVEAVKALRRVEDQLPVAQAALQVARDAHAKAQREVKSLEDRLEVQETTETEIVDQIAADERRSAEARANVGALARQALKGDMSTSTLAIMLEAEDAQEYVQQSGLVSTAMRSQNQLLAQLAQEDAANRNARVRLEAVRERITELRAAAVVKREEAREREVEAQEREAEVRQLIDTQRAKTALIESRKADLEALEAQHKRDRDSLEADLKRIIEEQRKKAEEERRRREEAGQQPAPKPGPVGKGIFQNPSSYSPMYITSMYGWRLHPVLGYRRLHAGIDLRAYCGMSILAGRSGTVVWARYRSGYGNQVMIDHGTINGNSVMSSYNHLQGFTVGAGAKVKGGNTVGYSGTTGTSTACHLHFEVYVNGKTVDPYPYL